MQPTAALSAARLRPNELTVLVRARRGPLIIGGLVALYVVAFSAVTIHRFATYSAFGDLATFEQILWNSVHGNPFGTTYGHSIFPFWSMVQDHIAVPVSSDGSYLGAHLEPWLLVLSAVYAVWPHTETLLVMQSLCIGLAAAPIYLLGKRVGSETIGVLAGAAFLVSPTLTGLNMLDFSGQAFSTLWIGAATYAVTAGKLRWYALFYAVAMSTNEVACVTLAALGLYLLVFTGRRTVGAASIAVAAGYFLFATRFLIPLFAPTADYPFAGYFSHWGGSPIELFRQIVSHPLDVLGFVAGPEQVIYIASLLLPVLFLPLLAPDLLLVAAPVLAANLLADSDAQRVPIGHYSATILPIIFMAAAVGLARLLAFLRPRLRPLTPRMALGFQVATIVVFGAFTLVMNTEISAWPLLRGLGWSSFVAPANVRTIDSALALVPDGVSVSTTDAFATHLARRRSLYLFPVGSDDAQYIVLPTDDHSSRIWPLTLTQLTSYTQTLLASGAFATEFNDDGVVVLHRVTSALTRLETAAFEDDDPSLVYNGAWQTVSDESSSGGSVHTSVAVGSSVSADFDGGRLIVVYRRCADCGTAVATIDGQDVGTIDTSGPSTSKLYHLFRILPGHHRITLALADWRSPFGEGARLYFDAFLVEAR